MTAAADTHHAGQYAAGPDRAATGANTVRLVSIEHQDAGGPDQSRTTGRTGTGDQGPAPAEAGHGRTIRSWPLLVLALPAAVAVWSGWVGIGRLTGFGEVHPLPGIWDSLHLDTAVTLPVGVEAYAAYALRAWLSASPAISARTRRFARWSAISSLVLGMAGQGAYHILTQARVTHAPWGITTAVSCLPVLILSMGAALTHLLSADAHGVKTDHAGSPASDQVLMRADQRTTRQAQAADTPRPGRLAEAEIVADRLRAAGQRVSRRTLRAAGLHGSNAELGVMARIITSRLSTAKTQTDPA